jgi:dGTPase
MQWNRLLEPKRIKGGEILEGSADALRSDFDRDYDRIIFSRPFRRLQDKTQVFPLPEDGFVHNRLTHSLEVASVARSLGRLVGQTLWERHSLAFLPSDIGAITSAAALCHDIGNPPFGHAGEEAISDFFRHDPDAQAFRAFVTDQEWQDLTHFEGNAQGFRLLMREEGKGLQLTLPTLASFTKYPKSASDPGDLARKSRKKYGYFQSEKELFEILATECGLRAIPDGGFLRHPLVFLVEAADDICYQLMDLEDGFSMGLLSFDTTFELMAPILKDQFDKNKLFRYSTDAERIAVLRAIAINTLVQESAALFLDMEGQILNGSFDHALTDYIPSAPAVKAISKVSVEKIYRSKPVLSREASGFEILSGLVKRYSMAVFHTHFAQGRLHARDKTIYRLLPEHHRGSLQQEDAKSLYFCLRVVIDAVSGMTDKEAVGHYRSIHGIPSK